VENVGEFPPIKNDNLENILREAALTNTLPVFLSTLASDKFALLITNRKTGLRGIIRG